MLKDNILRDAPEVIFLKTDEEIKEELIADPLDIVNNDEEKLRVKSDKKPRLESRDRDIKESGSE